MSELRDIIAAFLAALTRAQHDANRLSKRLGERYRDDKLLRYFPVPNALLDDVEAELRFAVIDHGRPQATAPLAETLTVERQSVVAPALEAARAALAALAEEIARAPPSAENEALLRNVTDTANAEQLAQQFSAPLRMLLQAQVDALLGVPTIHRRPVREQVTDALRRCLQAELDASPALAEFAGRPPVAAQLAEQAWEAADAAIAALAHRLADAVRDERALPAELDIELVTANTSQFPEYALQSLKLHARLRNYKWVIVDKATDQQELLPTD